MIAEKEKIVWKKESLSEFLGSFNPLSSLQPSKRVPCYGHHCSEPGGRPRKKPSMDFVGPYWGLQECLHNVDGGSEHSWKININEIK